MRTRRRAVAVAAAAQRADVALLTTLRTRGHTPELERAVTRYSRLGEHSRLWLTASTAGLLTHRGRRMVYLRCARALVTAEILNAFVKSIVGRRRPSIAHLPPLSATRSQFAHPSAHATTSFAAAGVLADALPPALPYAFATAMALSRPYLGVHYPSDIAVGCAFGLLLAKLID